MARPVRIEVPGGWYHVTARGNERKAVFRDDRDRRRFLELLQEWVERFGLRLHAYVLMENHYHLLVEMAEANLSQAMQWLQVSYTVWFNRRHRRVGHLFQGRYQAIILEPIAAAWEVSRYVHLNPVRVKGLGLDKAARDRERAGMGTPPAIGQVRERLERLRQYRWSSYRGYVGLEEVPRWQTTQTILGRGGDGGRAERRKAYRRYVEVAVREGVAESPWERLEGQMLLGGKDFVRRMKRLTQGNVREQPQLRQLRERPDFGKIVAVVERAKAEKWEAFRDRHSDWGRDVVLYLARERGGMRLGELAEAAGGLDYGSVQVAVRRLAKRLERDRRLAATVQKLKRELFDDET